MIHDDGGGPTPSLSSRSRNSSGGTTPDAAADWGGGVPPPRHFGVSHKHVQKGCPRGPCCSTCASQVNIGVKGLQTVELKIPKQGKLLIQNIGEPDVLECFLYLLRYMTLEGETYSHGVWKLTVDLRNLVVCVCAFANSEDCRLPRASEDPSKGLPKVA